MSVRNPASSGAHAHLNTLIKLLHVFQPERALAQFSKHADKRAFDVVSANALHFVTHASESDAPSEELLSRAAHAKKQIDTCFSHLAEVAAPKLKNKTVVAHPLDAFSTSVLGKAAHVRFISVNQAHINKLPLHKLEAHRAITAHYALDGADLLLIEPKAITPTSIVARKGARLLAELAIARGIPVYALATSWHATPRWHASHNDEKIPPQFLTGILSEHGIYAHDQFLGRVQKAFPWLL
jgi:translation initiation factor 2B subunit (eIF-2B alpha/beta/delta family)